MKDQNETHETRETHGKNQCDPATGEPSRETRLRALLFGGAALGTTLATLAVFLDPKLPRWVGE
jgi:hypothetical protein